MGAWESPRVKDVFKDLSDLSVLSLRSAVAVQLFTVNLGPAHALSTPPPQAVVIAYVPCLLLSLLMIDSHNKALK